MSQKLQFMAARGMEAQHVLANNQLLYTFTFSTTGATSSTTIPVAALGWDLAGAGRSNASTLAMSLTSQSVNTAGFKVGIGTNLFGSGSGANFVNFQLAISAGQATKFFTYVPGAYNGNPSSVVIVPASYVATNVVGGLGYMATETITCSLLFNGYAVGTGFPV